MKSTLSIAQQCNMGCPYCNLGKKQARMSAAVAKKIPYRKQQYTSKEIKWKTYVPHRCANHDVASINRKQNARYSLFADKSKEALRWN